MRQNAEQSCVSQRTDGTSEHLYFVDLCSPVGRSLKPTGRHLRGVNTAVL